MNAHRAQSETTRGQATRGELFAWALYDWANSAYSTLSITILNGYLLNVVFPPEAWGTTGELAWAWGIGGSMFVAGLVSPICGAWADAWANKRGGLAITALSGSAAMMLLALVDTSQPWLIVALFVAASFAFELSLGFYNGFLPELADETTMNRVSAWGFGLGYVGGGLVLILAMLLIQFGPSIGLATIDIQLRAGLMLLGVWWALFSLPAILTLRDRAPPRGLSGTRGQAARAAFGEVAKTLREVRRLPMLAWFLLGFLFYNDAVQTVISQASTFATRELAFTTGELAQVILMIQFLALPGAILVGRLADRWGAMHALHLCLAVWSSLLLVAYFIETKTQFWLLGVAVAMVMGGVQAVSRSIMGTLTPPQRSAEFFGFFNLSGKTTSFMGTFLFGAIIATFGSARWAIVSLLSLLLVGWWVVARVNLAQGRQEALGESGHSA